MTKKDRTGVFVTFDDRVEDLHAPTEGELKDLFRDLLRWREAQPEAMPPELWDRVGKLILWQMLPFEWTQERKDRVRWYWVRRAIPRRGWEVAFEYASDVLKGHPAEAGPDMIRKSYEKIERRLPSEQRRPKTYRRNPQLR
jgi:hypothetical protein